VHQLAHRRSALGGERDQGKKVASGLYAMVVPGSQKIKQQAEMEGLDLIFRQAGFDWRESGCSMCLGMNPTSFSRGAVRVDFKSKLRGPSGSRRPHSFSKPCDGGAAAIAGHFVDIREWD